MALSATRHAVVERYSTTTRLEMELQTGTQPLERVRSTAILTGFRTPPSVSPHCTPTRPATTTQLSVITRSNSTKARPQTPPLAILRSIIIPWTVTQPRVLLRSPVTPPAPATRPWVFKRSQTTSTATITLPSAKTPCFITTITVATQPSGLARSGTVPLTPIRPLALVGSFTTPPAPSIQPWDKAPDPPQPQGTITSISALE